MYYILTYVSRTVYHGPLPSFVEAKAKADEFHSKSGYDYVVEKREIVWSTMTLNRSNGDCN